MNTTELMQLGRRQVKETDAALLRSEKVVNDTMAIGIQTAETLQGQTRQLEKARGQRAAGGQRWSAAAAWAVAWGSRRAGARCCGGGEQPHSLTLLTPLLTD